MQKIISCTLVVLAFMYACPVFSQGDSTYIRVHFLHGSKPKKKYRHEEDKWFGGMLGGHAGVEINENEILNFQPAGRFHFFSKRHLINSRFSIHDTVSFYGILGGKPNAVKRTIITIPVSAQQKKQLDSIVVAYREKTPYDYAFFGMRCGAAAYDVLSHAGIVQKFGYKKTYRKIFYPRRLRRRLERKAVAGHYNVKKVQGSEKRKWEKD